MSEPREIRLRDGRSATLRMTRGDDAEAILALERGLAEDGRGMVVAPDQLRTPEIERGRIDDFYRKLSAGDASLLAVAASDAGILAHGELKQLSPRRCQHVGIFSLGVAVQAQRLGIGRALMEYLVDHARTAGLQRLELYTRADNTRARALYESLGFAVEGVRRGFVRLEDGTLVDDLVMVRFL